MISSLSLLLSPLACVAAGDGAGRGEDADARSEAVVSVPPKGAANTLDVGGWNIEWFGSTAEGPTNEALQLSNVRDVIAGADLDLWALEEVVSATSFNQLKAQLPGYAGFLANDPSVTNGAAYYSSGEQKTGVLYKPGVVTVNGAKIILTASNTDFAGRPPLEVSATVTLNGAMVDLVFIVLHAKAFSDTTSYNKRKNASAALKSYLDSATPTQVVLVVGDFNDDVDTSIKSGQPSPYANFVTDPARYFFPTKALSDAGVRSTLNGTQMIDHHLLTNEAEALYLAGSAEVYRVDAYVPSYGSTTSDHFPVLCRYAIDPPVSGPPHLLLNEILANEPGSSTAGELVELVNAGDGAADLGGYTLSDATSVRHVFPPGATLAPGAAAVVFASASAIPPGLINATAASTGTLSLANGGDTVTLKDGAGAVVDSFPYPSSLASADGVSMNRNPDGDPDGTFVLHTALTAAPSSPGKRVTGASFP